MISVEEAKNILINIVEPLSRHIVVKAGDALGFTLAENIYAPVHLPPFNQSNVDGYAVKLASNDENRWKVVAEIRAGDKAAITLDIGEAARIFTGAMVPAGGDLVIMQERIHRSDNTITYKETTTLKRDENIRYEGAQIKKNNLAVEAGTICTPAVIGFVASLGIDAIKVVSKPKIVLIITGNELQPAGETLTAGKVYESNSLTLVTALQVMHLDVEKVVFVRDDKSLMDKTIPEVMQAGPDVVLISGGISVGDYDFVKDSLEENGTVPFFYKVAQKPGKPLYFGKNENTFIFGLPGNPASALTCFYEYVYPALRKLQGRTPFFLSTVQVPVSKEIVKKKGLAVFLKAIVNNDRVEPLQGQDSFILKSFTDANAFIYLPADKEGVSAGEKVEVHLLP